MPAAIPDRIQTQLRIDELIHAKVKIISKQEDRTMNSQLEYFIKKGVEQYERENGKIILP